MRMRIVVGGVVVLVAVGAGVLWYLARESPELVDLDRAIAELADLPGTGGSGVEEGVEQAVILDPTGTWTVDPDVVPFDRIAETGTWVGYRIDEELAGRGAVVAVGRTPRVTGDVLIDGSRVIAADIRADLARLVSGNGTRDARIEPIFTDRPASFTLTAPVEFGAVPAAGQNVAATAVGVLRIGEVEREVSFELSAGVVGETLVIAGSTVVTLADFDVEVPSVPLVLRVSEEATIELLLHLTRR